MHQPKKASPLRTLTTVPRPLLAVGITLAAALAAPAATITFSDLDPGPEGYWNGTAPVEQYETATTTFTSGTATFANSVTNWGDGFSSWTGFVYSNLGDTVTPGSENQYSSVTGGDVEGDGTFVMASGDSRIGAEGPTITLSGLTNMNGLGAYFTNATYTALSIRYGDGFSDPFADSDYLKLTIHGYNGLTQTGTVDFYLADFRNGASNIVELWQWVDLSDLLSVDRLTFSFDSSDASGPYINKPAYFAMDNLLSVPEPSTALASLAGLALLARRRRRS